MTNILLILNKVLLLAMNFFVYQIYKEIRGPVYKIVKDRYFKFELDKEEKPKEELTEEFDKEESEREQLQKEFDNVMSYKIDDAVNAYKRGD